MACNGKVERRRREAEIANSTPESHDAVVAEMRRGSGTETGWIGIDTARNWADRVESAHARELAEQQATHAAEVGHERRLRDIAESVTEATRDQRDNAVARVDAAMGLLREVTEWIDGWNPNFVDDSEWQPVADRIDAFLAQQALACVERKDG